MGNPLVAILLLLSCSLGSFVANVVAEDIGKLVSVAVLFRHGDRAPKTSFPNDPYFNTSYWPMGFKQLTNVGKRRQYNLGKWLRNRYSTFLSDAYHPSDIYVRSSDVDRTLMSAAANLAGLYPPTPDQVWTDEIKWQPIPIHTLKKKKDLVISMKKKCKKYNKQLEALDTTDFFINLNEQNADFYQYLSNQTGWEVDDISFVQDLWSIFQSYKSYNASYLPSWADSLDEDLVNTLTGIAYAKDTYTEELKRLRIGPFFQFLIEHFDNIIAQDEDEAKFLMLSGHESTVAAVLNGMGAYDYLQPEFACAVIWELRQRDNGTYFINIYYKKEAAVQHIIAEGCDIYCEYESFKSVLDPIAISDDDWDDECG